MSNERKRLQRSRATTPRQTSPSQDSGWGARQVGRGVAPMINRALESEGSPLNGPTRQMMEGRFGHDFSQVRVHTDARADASAQAVQARAYTVGHDIVFRAGEYNHASTDGQHLLAHELTHVVQQGESSGGVQAQLEVSEPGDPAEVEAEAVAREVMAGEDVEVADASVQRQAMQREVVPEEEEPEEEEEEEVPA
jgi:hypothetical protein